MREERQPHVPKLAAVLLFFKKVKPSQLRKPFEAVRRRVVREKNAAYIIAVLKVTVGPEHGANGI